MFFSLREKKKNCRFGFLCFPCSLIWVCQLKESPLLQRENIGESDIFFFFWGVLSIECTLSKTSLYSNTKLCNCSCIATFFVSFSPLDYIAVTIFEVFLLLLFFFLTFYLFLPLNCFLLIIFWWVFFFNIYIFIFFIFFLLTGVWLIVKQVYFLSVSLCDLFCKNYIP